MILTSQDWQTLKAAWDAGSNPPPDLADKTVICRLLVKELPGLHVSATSRWCTDDNVLGGVATKMGPYNNSPWVVKVKDFFGRREVLQALKRGPKKERTPAPTHRW